MSSTPSVPITPRWALEKIEEVKRNRLDYLNLTAHSYPELNSIPDEILELAGLKTLILTGNHIQAIPDSITQLANLEVLYLSDNKLSTVPDSITQLPNLEVLYLSDNKLTSVSDSISRLANLKELYLRNNLLSTVPKSIAQLQNLKILDLSRNRLDTFPEPINELQSLILLSLAENHLDKVPESIARLRNLIELYLYKNQLDSLPEEITHLLGLKVLNLRSNQLTAIPRSIIRMPKLAKVYFDNNPLITPPIEIAKKGIVAIRQYFEQLGQQGEDYLYEAKLLVLGEGGAGKTTFANKIKNLKYELKEEDSTKGVDVLPWSFPMENGREFRVNIWDFGGQEIYHATHQFFLTKRSLYILVADTRKDDTDFYYWLNTAELLGDSSPLLIVKNEKQDRHREINERALKSQFDCLKEVRATNLATNRGLEQVLQEIKHHIVQLPHIGSPLPRTWVRVREQLEGDRRNYISIEEYSTICRANGFTELKDILQLSGYLNDIGVFLHFQDDPLLRKTVILKPKWGTDAVYKVLDDKAVIQNQGRFTRAELQRIWNAPEYESMRDELLQLMMNFRLCYEIPTQKGFYIAPQLLTENQPDYKWNAGTQDNLLLRYSYEFMPKGILTQLIVVMHPYILEQKMVWKSGIVIEKDNTRAEVIEYYGKREIHVRVTGPQARELMTIVRFQLKQIHDSYKRLRYDELIRCNCPTCRDSQEPYFYPLSTLMKFKEDNQLQIQCQRSYNMVNVMSLLGDVIDLSKLAEKELSQAVYNVQGNFIQQTISKSNIGGSVAAAEDIQNSFNTKGRSNASDLQEQLSLLDLAVRTLAKKLPEEQAEELADDMKRLREEAAKEKPSAKWYNLSIDGLVAAAQNQGEAGNAVIEMAGKVRTILAGERL